MEENGMNIAICDDEERQRDIIQQYILVHKENYPKMTISNFSSGEELVSAYANGGKFDFLFLDIRMKDIDGIKAAKEIRKTDRNVIIFFFTSFTQYISAVFPLNAFQFLVKPVKQNTFDSEFKRAIKKHLIKRKKYVVDGRSKIIALEVKDIMYLEIFRRRIIVYTKNNQYEKIGKMKDEEKKLKLYGFVRTHHSFLVNMSFVLEIAKNEVILKNGKTVMLSERKRSDALKRFNEFMAGCSL
jgi:DNA-binding LytR/AlgR family response regulator